MSYASWKPRRWNTYDPKVIYEQHFTLIEAPAVGYKEKNFLSPFISFIQFNYIYIFDFDNFVLHERMIKSLIFLNKRRMDEQILGEREIFMY